MKKSCIYTRISSPNLDHLEQIDQCKREAERMDIEVAKIFSEIGIGKIDKLQILGDAVTYCIKNKVDIFITYSLSRLSRDEIESKSFLEKMDGLGIQVVFAEDNKSAG